MKKFAASLGLAFMLIAASPAQGFQSHPKPRKVQKHRTKGSGHRHWIPKRQHKPK